MCCTRNMIYNGSDCDTLDSDGGALAELLRKNVAPRGSILLSAEEEAFLRGLDSVSAFNVPTDHKLEVCPQPRCATCEWHESAQSVPATSSSKLAAAPTVASTYATRSNETLQGFLTLSEEHSRGSYNHEGKGRRLAKGDQVLLTCCLSKTAASERHAAPQTVLSRAAAAIKLRRISCISNTSTATALQSKQRECGPRVQAQRIQRSVGKT
eukprot:2900480-Pleurochrysis_carterae.AAC.1